MNADCEQAPVIGIVGAPSAGKSAVARLLAERGARVVDADRIGHGVLERADVRSALARAFGPQVLDAQGAVDRGRLAEAAFASPEAVRALNAVVHPPILEEIRRRVAELRARGGVQPIVLDAALLIETHLDSELCDAVIFVDAPRQARLARAASGRAMSPEHYARREGAQLPEERKRASADFIIDNGGSACELSDRVGELWPTLCRLNSGGRTESRSR